MSFSSPWNLSLLLPYTAPKLPGLVLAEIYILKCDSHLNSDSIDPFIVHFKPRAICALFHWNGCVPHPENNVSLCHAFSHFQTMASLVKISFNSSTHLWKCVNVICWQNNVSNLGRNQIMHAAHWCPTFLSFKTFGSWRHGCELNHFTTAGLCCDEFSRQQFCSTFSLLLVWTRAQEYFRTKMWNIKSK